MVGAVTAVGSQLATASPDVDVEDLDRDPDNRGLGGQRDLVGEHGMKRGHLLVHVVGVHRDASTSWSKAGLSVTGFPLSARP